jgi:hypothetical protein
MSWLAEERRRLQALSGLLDRLGFGTEITGEGLEPDCLLAEPPADFSPSKEADPEFRALQRDRWSAVLPAEAPFPRPYFVLWYDRRLEKQLGTGLAVLRIRAPVDEKRHFGARLGLNRRELSAVAEVLGPQLSFGFGRFGYHPGFMFVEWEMPVAETPDPTVLTTALKALADSFDTMAATILDTLRKRKDAET